MLSFSMAHLSLIRLRVSEPDARRPYRSPGRLRVRGHDLPPLAIVGLTGTALSFVVVSVLDLQVGAAGVTWMALGMAGYVLYRRRQGLDLVSTHQVVAAAAGHRRPRPSTSRCSSRSTRATTRRRRSRPPPKLAGRKRRGIHVLVLDHRAAGRRRSTRALPEEELAARAIIEQAPAAGRPARQRPRRERAPRPGAAG